MPKVCDIFGICRRAVSIVWAQWSLLLNFVPDQKYLFLIVDVLRQVSNLGIKIKMPSPCLNASKLCGVYTFENGKTSQSKNTDGFVFDEGSYGDPEKCTQDMMSVLKSLKKFYDRKTANNS